MDDEGLALFPLAAVAEIIAAVEELEQHILVDRLARYRLLEHLGFRCGKSFGEQVFLTQGPHFRDRQGSAYGALSQILRHAVLQEFEQVLFELRGQKVLVTRWSGGLVADAAQHARKHIRSTKQAMLWESAEASIRLRGMCRAEPLPLP